jgi:hypothetical protein
MKELITRSTRIRTSIIDSFNVSDWLVGDNYITDYSYIQITILLSVSLIARLCLLLEVT